MKVKVKISKLKKVRVKKAILKKDVASCLAVHSRLASLSLKKG